MFLEISRVPAGGLAFNSAFTVIEVETMIGMVLVLWSAFSSWRTVKPSTAGICRSRMITSGFSSRASRIPSSPPSASMNS